MEKPIWGIKETKELLSKQRTKFLWIIGFITAGLIVLSVSTTYLALKLNGAYPTVRVEYHVWNHQNPLLASRKAMELKVPENSTVYTLIEHSASKSTHFEFEFKQYAEFGKYITSIGGVSSDEDKGLFWMLYKLKDTPDINNPPTMDLSPEFGIDFIRVKEGDVYLFWLTKLDLDSPLRLRNSDNLKQPCVPLPTDHGTFTI